MLVDVILPNFNKGEYLEEAIDSVLSQSYKNWKLYIIDDHSSDNSYKVLQKFERPRGARQYLPPTGVCAAHTPSAGRCHTLPDESAAL